MLSGPAECCGAPACVGVCGAVENGRCVRMGFHCFRQAPEVFLRLETERCLRIVSLREPAVHRNQEIKAGQHGSLRYFASGCPLCGTILQRRIWYSAQAGVNMQTVSQCEGVRPVPPSASLGAPGTPARQDAARQEMHRLLNVSAHGHASGIFQRQDLPNGQNSKTGNQLVADGDSGIDSSNGEFRACTCRPGGPFREDHDCRRSPDRSSGAGAVDRERAGPRSVCRGS